MRTEFLGELTSQRYWWYLQTLFSFKLSCWYFVGGINHSEYHAFWDGIKEIYLFGGIQELIHR